MHKLIAAFLLMLPFSTIAAPHGCTENTVLEGEYISAKGIGFLPNTLSVTSGQDSDQFHFDIESYWSSKADDDGSATTQGIFSGEFSVRWCLGHYVSKDGGCFLVFQFEPNQIKVASFGVCQYGHNAYPDATYKKQ